LFASRVNRAYFASFVDAHARRRGRRASRASSPSRVEPAAATIRRVVFASARRDATQKRRDDATGGARGANRAGIARSTRARERGREVGAARDRFDAILHHGVKIYLYMYWFVYGFVYIYICTVCPMCIFMYRRTHDAIRGFRDGDARPHLATRRATTNDASRNARAHLFTAARRDRRSSLDATAT
jgi:hypothetical protein